MCSRPEHLSRRNRMQCTCSHRFNGCGSDPPTLSLGRTDLSRLRLDVIAFNAGSISTPTKKSRFLLNSAPAENAGRCCWLRVSLNGLRFTTRDFSCEFGMIRNRFSRPEGVYRKEFLRTETLNGSLETTVVFTNSGAVFDESLRNVAKGHVGAMRKSPGFNMAGRILTVEIYVQC